MSVAVMSEGARGRSAGTGQRVEQGAAVRGAAGSPRDAAAGWPLQEVRLCAALATEPMRPRPARANHQERAVSTGCTAAPCAVRNEAAEAGCGTTNSIFCWCSVGGLAPSLVVELANGSRAVVLDVSEDSVKLDANSMLAGKKLVFEIELVNIEASS